MCGGGGAASNQWQHVRTSLWGKFGGRRHAFVVCSDALDEESPPFLSLLRR